MELWLSRASLLVTIDSRPSDETWVMYLFIKVHASLLSVQCLDNVADTKDIHPVGNTQPLPEVFIAAIRHRRVVQVYLEYGR